MVLKVMGLRKKNKYLVAAQTVGHIFARIVLSGIGVLLVILGWGCAVAAGYFYKLAMASTDSSYELKASRFFTAAGVLGVFVLGAMASEIFETVTNERGHKDSFFLLFLCVALPLGVRNFVVGISPFYFF